MNDPLKIDLNGLLINSETTGFYLDGDVEGLDFPDIRTSSGELSGQHGGYVGAQLLGMRMITLEGRAFHSEVAPASALRTQLQAVMAGMMAPNVGKLKVQMYDGRSYLLYVHSASFQMPISNSPNFSPFKIDLIAPDPIIYDNTSDSDLVTSIARRAAAGAEWPWTWPVDWGVASGPVTVANNGTVFILPVITLTGVMTNPQVANETTGQIFKLDGLTTATGDVLKIDMNMRTVTLNGSSILAKRTNNSEWWGLAVGNNAIALDTASGSDTVAGLIAMRNGVLGI